MGQVPDGLLLSLAGHSPDNEPEEPARPKAARPPSRPSTGGNARPAAVPAAGIVPASAPWITEKKRQLQVCEVLC